MKNIVLLLISLLVIAGCEHKQNDSEQQTKSVENSSNLSSVSDSTNTAVADSMAKLKTEVKAFRENMQSLVNKIDTQEEDIRELKDSKANKYFWLIVSIPILLVVILIITIYKFGHSFTKKIDFRNEVSSLRQKIKILETKSNHGIYKTDYTSEKIQNGQNTDSNYDVISAQIKSLESRLQALEKDTTQKEYPSSNSTKKITIVYFGNLKKGNDFYYFNDKYDSCKDEAKFKAYLNGKDDKFELVDIRRVLSSDANKNAITYSKGSASINETNGFELINAGKVHFERKNDYGDIWILDKPVEIKLTK